LVSSSGAGGVGGFPTALAFQERDIIEYSFR
jgi:hypothetical protein